MAINFLQNVNFNKNEIQNIRVQNSTSDPTGAVTGQLYYNTTDSILRVYNGTDWLDLAVSTGGSAISGITGTNGVTATEVGGLVTVQHADTSTQADVTNTGNAYIQSIDLDDFGHIVGVSSDTITLAALGYTGADDADNYNGFTVIGNTGVSDTVTSADSFTIIGDGNDTTVAALEMTITNTDKGSAQNIYKSLAADTGTDAAATNSDTLTFTGGDGVDTAVASVTGGSELTFAVDSTVVRTTGTQTIGGNKTFSNNVSIEGNLTVSGATTTTISETVQVEDSIILLNSNAPDEPVDDAGIAVFRGAENTAYMMWDESEDEFVVCTTTSGDDASSAGDVTIAAYADFQAAGIKGSTLTLSGIVAATTDTDAFLVSDSGVIKKRTGAQVRSDIGAGTVTSVGVTATAPLSVVSGSPITSTGTIDLAIADASETVKGAVELADAAETKAMSSKTLAVTPFSLSSLRAAANIGDGANVSFDIAHDLGTRDIIVQLYDNSTYETVYTDVTRTDDVNVNISFTTAPTTDQYRVLIYKI